MDENAVVHAVCTYLEETGHEILQRLHTTQHGVDIIARDKTTRCLLYIEAKGATSSREGSARFGLGFTSTQVFDRVAKGLYTGLCLRAAHPDRTAEEVGLAFPDTAGFRCRLEPIRQQLADAGVVVFLASPQGPVTRL